MGAVYVQCSTACVLVATPIPQSCFARPGPARPRNPTSLDSYHHISKNLISSLLLSPSASGLHKSDPTRRPADPLAVESQYNKIKSISRLVVCPTCLNPSASPPAPTIDRNPQPLQSSPYLLSLRRPLNSHRQKKNISQNVLLPFYQTLSTAITRNIFCYRYA